MQIVSINYFVQKIRINIFSFKEPSTESEESQCNSSIRGISKKIKSKSTVYNTKHALKRHTFNSRCSSGSDDVQAILLGMDKVIKDLNSRDTYDTWGAYMASMLRESTEKGQITAAKASDIQANLVNHLNNLIWNSNS